MATEDWIVDVPDIVRQEIDGFGRLLSARMYALLDFVRQIGPMNLPRASSKHLREIYYEFRVIGPDGVARAIYVMCSGKRVQVLVGFVKKTQRTPGKYLRLAEERRRRLEG